MNFFLYAPKVPGGLSPSEFPTKTVCHFQFPHTCLIRKNMNFWNVSVFKILFSDFHFTFVKIVYPEDGCLQAKHVGDQPTA
jgi:hypothetical protein